MGNELSTSSQYGDEMLEYDVYLIRNEGLHHFLVMRSKRGQVCVRVELTVGFWGKAVFQHSNYKGKLDDKDYQGRVVTTLDNILSIGRHIIDMKYNNEYTSYWNRTAKSFAIPI